MKIRPMGSRAATAGTGTLAGGLTGPASLDEQYEEVVDGTDVQVRKTRQGPDVVVVKTREELKQLGTDLETTGFDGPSITLLLLAIMEKCVQFWIQRTGANPNRKMPDLPQNFEKVLPSTDTILGWVKLLLVEAPNLFTQEEEDSIRKVRTLVADNQAIIDIFAPIMQGATINMRLGLKILFDFCTHVGTNGRSAIEGNFVLHQKMKPLLDMLDGNAQQALVTKHLKDQVAHQVEARVLEETKQNIANAVAGTPLVGAHAPGQNPVPPGALPLTVVPQPKHPKPARRGGPTPKHPKSKGTPPKNG